MLTTPLYLACLNLRGRAALVVGAGKIALEKIEGLLTCEAKVTVVAPDAIAEVEALAGAGTIRWERRPYADEDLDGYMLAIAATSDTELNTKVYRAAEDRSMLVNVVDVPDLCNFILPAVMRSGPLAIAVSTSGASPALAKRIRREISEVIGPEYAQLAGMLDSIRDWARSTLPTYDDRREFFDDLVGGDPDPIALLRAGDVAWVETLIRGRIAAADAKRKSG